jgi:hypothetical protein
MKMKSRKYILAPIFLPILGLWEPGQTAGSEKGTGVVLFLASIKRRLYGQKSELFIFLRSMFLPYQDFQLLRGTSQRALRFCYGTARRG